MTYPLQYFRIAIGDTDNNISASGSSLIPSHHTGKTTEKWYLNYVKKDTFQIVNASSNQVMTGNKSMFLFQIILHLLLNIGLFKEYKMIMMAILYIIKF